MDRFTSGKPTDLELLRLQPQSTHVQVCVHNYEISDEPQINHCRALILDRGPSNPFGMAREIYIMPGEHDAMSKALNHVHELTSGYSRIH